MRSFFLCLARPKYVKISHKEDDYEKTKLAAASMYYIFARGLF